MKKLFVLFLACTLPIWLVAQLNFGLKAGANYTNVRDHIAPDDAPEALTTERLIGIHFGAFTQKRIAPHLELQLELLYNQKGTKTTFSATTNDQRFHYLSLPVLFSWEVLPAFHLNAGTELNFLLSADAPGNFRVLDEDRKVDVSALLGISVDLSDRWMLDARYTHGLLALSDVAVFDQASFPEVAYKWYNQSLQIAIHRLF